MSAADWRKAMNAGAGRYAWTGGAAGRRAAVRDAARPSPRPSPLRGEGEVAGDAIAWARWVGRRVGARHVLVLLAVLVYPWVATPFFTYQIGAQALALGLIALSLTFLAGYGGMVSLAQMTVAGIAGYMYAIFATSGTRHQPALALGARGRARARDRDGVRDAHRLVLGAHRGHLHDHDHAGDRGGLLLPRPAELLALQRLPGLPERDDARGGRASSCARPIIFYYLALFWSLAGYFFVSYLLRAPFGVALQGIRDNPRRMSALGFNVTAHRVAAYAVAGVIAAVGGILMVWYNGLVSPGSVGTSWLINILIIAVLGGMRHPIGPFIGAIVFVLLQNFAVDLVGRERFNLLIGGVFLVIVLFSTDGLLGWWAQGRRSLQAQFHRGPGAALTQRRRGR